VPLAGTAHTPSELAPPIAVVLHLPTAATAEVRATDDLRIDDIRALRGIELRAGVELHKVRPSSKVTLRGKHMLQAYVSSV
jgi:hypothetical protein